MSIAGGVYPNGGAGELTKHQVEKMIECGLVVDDNFAAKIDRAIFPFVVYHDVVLIESGVGVGKLRKHVGALYDSLPWEAQMLFQLVSLVKGSEYLTEIAMNIKPLLGGTKFDAFRPFNREVQTLVSLCDKEAEKRGVDLKKLFADYPARMKVLSKRFGDQ